MRDILICYKYFMQAGIRGEIIKPSWAGGLTGGLSSKIPRGMTTSKQQRLHKRTDNKKFQNQKIIRDNRTVKKKKCNITITGKSTISKISQASLSVVYIVIKTKPSIITQNIMLLCSAGTSDAFQIDITGKINRYNTKERCDKGKSKRKRIIRKYMSPFTKEMDGQQTKYLKKKKKRSRENSWLCLALPKVKRLSRICPRW